MFVRSLVVVLIASAGLLRWAPNASAELVMVRIVGENVTVKTRPSRLADTLAKPQPDEILEVLSQEGSWFWVLVERDNHGTQRAGWVRESDVEFVDSAVARFFPAPTPPPAREEPPVEGVEEVAAAAPVEASPEETVAADTAGPDAAIVCRASEAASRREAGTTGAGERSQRWRSRRRSTTAS